MMDEYEDLGPYEEYDEGEEWRLYPYFGPGCRPDLEKDTDEDTFDYL